MADELIQPYNGDPFAGNLATPINSSDLTKSFLDNLPIYRKGLSPIQRGLEIGMAHGYFLMGPWTKLGPLRDSNVANLGGLIGAIALILVATVAMSAYGGVSFQKDTSQASDSVQSASGWSQLTSGFFLGAMGGAFVAYFLLANFDVVDSIMRGLVNN